MYARPLTAFAAVTLLAAASTAQTSASADYEVRFDATWSATTHPGAYPSFAHFSPLVGATHDGSVRLWQPGALATNGIEVMAETGSTGALSSEVNTAIGQGAADQVLIGAGILSPANTTMGFTATSNHSKLTLVTMIAPSPDWFLGVDSFELFENGRWIDQAVVELFAWDSGTDSGTGFNSANQNTNPAAPIQLVTGGPFFGTTPLGTFTITRTSGATYCTGKVNSQGALSVIDSTGSASFSSSASFDVLGADIVNNKNGLLFYGFADQSAPFQGGTLCVQGPLQRTAVQNSGGSASGDDATGTFAFDMNALIQGGSDPSLTPGTRVFAQYWYRDPQSPSGTGLTNGLDFVVLP